jgi:DNA repair ATPase RecN
VDEQTVTFTPGLNVITGQSGAGKSILVRGGCGLAGGALVALTTGGGNNRCPTGV